MNPCCVVLQEKIEAELEKSGFEEGTSDRKRKYKVLEVREYNVDDSFPRVTVDSFKNGKMPAAVVQFTYSIDLDAVKKYKIVDF